MVLYESIELFGKGNGRLFGVDRQQSVIEIGCEGGSVSNESSCRIACCNLTEGCLVNREHDLEGRVLKAYSGVNDSRNGDGHFFRHICSGEFSFQCGGRGDRCTGYCCNGSQCANDDFLHIL